VLTLSNAETLSGEVAVTQATATGTIAETETPTGDHAYYEALIARPDLFTKNAFRDQPGDVAVSSVIGATDKPYSTTYSPETDTYANAQDAAKSVVPAFGWPQGGTQRITVAAAGVNDSTLRIPLTTLANVDHTTHYKFDSPRPEVASEVVKTGPSTAYRDQATVEMIVTERGTFSTPASAHVGGVQAWESTNSVYNQLRPHVGGTPGHTYFFTWDGYFGKEWLRCGIGTYKWFQIEKVGDAIWIEPQIRFGGNPGGGMTTPPEFNQDIHVGVPTVRFYPDSVIAPTTDANPVRPMANYPADQFCIFPDRWVRWFFYITLNVAPDNCYVSAWIADEERDPVLLLDNLPRTTSSEIAGWRMELNTSTNALPTGRATAYPHLGLVAFRDLIHYTRNLVVLEDVDPGDIAGLLVKPTA
jgi:hypothetical protein